MKKFLSVATVFVLLVAVLAGCQTSQNAQPSEAVSQQPPATEHSAAVPAVTESATQITGDEALQIALEDAVLSPDQIHDLDMDLEKENGVLYFDVDFEADGYDYDYEIDAKTGNILNSRKEKDDK